MIVFVPLVLGTARRVVASNKRDFTCDFDVCVESGRVQMILFWWCDRDLIFLWQVGLNDYVYWADDILMMKWDIL